MFTLNLRIGYGHTIGYHLTCRTTSFISKPEGGNPVLFSKECFAVSYIKDLYILNDSGSCNPTSQETDVGFD